MPNLSVSYMGLVLKSPFLASSSGFTAKMENLAALENAGAGAIVLKSLFEEQINDQARFLSDQSAEYPENADFLHYYLTQHSVSNYLELIREAKKTVSVPVIASVNCFSTGSWLSFAGDMEKAGADALEINIYSLPLTLEKNSDSIENDYFKVITSLAKSLRIPIAVKIGHNFTNLPQFVSTLKSCGARGAVLFNRFYQPDIDLKEMSIVAADPFSHKGEYLNELRWIALVSSMVRGLDLSASTGVHAPEDAIKLILAGARTVQLCSILYTEGAGVVKSFTDGLENFMTEKGMKNVGDLCGLLNYSNIAHPDKFERVQFMKTFGGKS